MTKIDALVKELEEQQLKSGRDLYGFNTILDRTVPLYQIALMAIIFFLLSTILTVVIDTMEGGLSNLFSTGNNQYRIGLWDYYLDPEYRDEAIGELFSNFKFTSIAFFLVAALLRNKTIVTIALVFVFSTPIVGTIFNNFNVIVGLGDYRAAHLEFLFRNWIYQMATLKFYVFTALNFMLVYFCLNSLNKFNQRKKV